MRNLWEFLLQTANLTLVALFLLLLKRLLRHNLPPRWQYGIWGLFALRALLPASALRQVLLPLSWPLELARLAVERRFPGRFTDLAAPIAPRHPLPQLTALPHSLTDWLFVLYLLGVLLSLVRLLRSAGDLRRLLALGEAPSDVVRDKVEAVAAAHGLPTCRIVLVEDLSTAFVTGVLRPVLVLPAGKEPDELVLLHELLHLRSRDQLQNLLWAGLRALHWCNPLLWPVFDRIGNDMEQFCDQRVLERLEGEQRREYGHTLLSMATERYARAPGTTSIANGSAHIARRIEAIVHFRRYPQGTALAAWCVALMLVRPILWGGALDLPASALIPNGEKEILPALTAARLLRCTTPAGAIDTYAKGLLYQNGVWLAMASPAAAAEGIETALRDAAAQGDGRLRIRPGAELTFPDKSQVPRIYNLTPQKDGSCTAQVALRVLRFSEGDVPVEGPWYLTSDRVEPSWLNRGSVILTLRLFKEGGGWVAEETAPRILTTVAREDALLKWHHEGFSLPVQRTTGKTGTVEIYTVSLHRPDEGQENAMRLTPHLILSEIDVKAYARYTANDSGPRPARWVALEVGPQNLFGKVWFSDDKMTREVSGGSSSGLFYDCNKVEEGWDGTADSSGRILRAFSGAVDGLAPEWGVRIHWDGEIVEELEIEEENS